MTEGLFYPKTMEVGDGWHWREWWVDRLFDRWGLEQGWVRRGELRVGGGDEGQRGLFPCARPCLLLLATLGTGLIISTW